MEDQIVILTKDLADAICDMDDIGFSEGLGPEKTESSAEWDKLVAAAEKRTLRSCDRTNWREMTG